VGSLLVVVPSPGTAQSASEILDRALQRYEQRAEGIHDYTVVQSTEGDAMGMGMPGAASQKVTTIYFEKTMVHGHPVFVQHNATLDSLGQMQELAGVSRSTAETLRLMKEHASLQGTDVVEGHECWNLHVDDPEALAHFQEAGGGDARMRRALDMCLDKEEYVPRRLTLEGDTSVNGQTRPMTLTSTMSDYREVDGLLYPFKTEVRMSGVASSSMSPEEREKTRAQLAEAKASMAEMPEAQRAMVEKTMSGQIERLEKMLADDALTTTFVVQDVKVNAGPPRKGDGGGM